MEPTEETVPKQTRLRAKQATKALNGVNLSLLIRFVISRSHVQVTFPAPKPLARACLNIGDVSSGEGFWAAGKQFFRRNPDGFQGKIAPSRGQKARRLGMLTCFKQALDYLPKENCQDKRSQDFLWQDVPWGIWGQAAQNGGGKVIKAAPKELKEKYRQVFA